MKTNHISTIIILVLLTAAVVIFLLGKSTPAPESSAPEVSSVQSQPEFREGSFVQSQNGEGTFIQGKRPAEISFRGAQDGKTVLVSWDESKARIFHIVLLNVDWQAIWLISSLGTLPENDEDIQRQDVSSFIPAGYVLGDRTQEFQYFEEPDELELIVGQKYYFQAFAFTKNNQTVTINKTFTFTSSCLSPDCQ